MASFYLDTTPELFLNWLDRMSFRDIGRIYDVFAGTTEDGATYSFMLSYLRKLKPTYDARAEVGEVYVQDIRWDRDETVVYEEVIDYSIKPIGKNRIEFMVAWNGIQGVIWELFQELIEAYPEAKPEFVKWTDTFQGRQEHWAAKFDEWWDRERLFMLPPNLILNSVGFLMDLYNAGEDVTQAAIEYDEIVKEKLNKRYENTRGIPRFDLECERTLAAWNAWIARLQDKVECSHIANRLLNWSGTGGHPEGATTWNKYTENTRNIRLWSLSPEMLEWEPGDGFGYPRVCLEEQEQPSQEVSEKPVEEESTTTGMRHWRKKRAQLFKELKDQNPYWTQEKVAAEAPVELQRRIRENHPTWDDEKVEAEALRLLGGQWPRKHTVRNDYAKMGWEWERGDRIR
jgi:hypothetical protein